MPKIIAAKAGDQALLKGILEADSRRIQQVYDQALPAVIRWVAENNGTEQDARDVFQEAMIALFRKLEGGDFTLSCTLTSYLRILCRNLWLVRLRDGKKFQATPLEGIEAVDLSHDMLEQLGQAERQRLFFKHFDALGEKCRRILSLFFDKTPLAEIAQQLGTSEGYIKKRKFECKEKLVKAVQRDPLFQELKNE